jgi:DNA-binding NarL/FixJ family response regulator
VLDARPFLAEITDIAARARVELVDPVGPDSSTPAQARGSRPAPASVPELADLTARELEVLTEMAKGLTNREIAERLFISEKTVSVHVSHILNKIGARTRVQASAILHRVRVLRRDPEVSPVGADNLTESS